MIVLVCDNGLVLHYVLLFRSAYLAHLQFTCHLR